MHHCTIRAKWRIFSTTLYSEWVTRKKLSPRNCTGKNVCRFTPNRNRKTTQWITCEKRLAAAAATAKTTTTAKHIAMGYCLARPIFCKVSFAFRSNYFSFRHQAAQKNQLGVHCVVWCVCVCVAAAVVVLLNTFVLLLFSSRLQIFVAPTVKPTLSASWHVFATAFFCTHLYVWAVVALQNVK